VNDLEAVVKQEYNRMVREYARRQQNKEDFDAGRDNNIVLNFNGTLDRDNPALADVEQDSKLRAFKFNKLEDFFTDHKDLEQKFRDAAKAGADFTALTEELGQLRTELNNYAQREFQKYFNKMKTLGVIKPLSMPGAYMNSFIPDKITGQAGKDATIGS